MLLTVAPREGTRPPGPPSRGLLGHQPAYAADPLGTFRRWTAEYGDTVRLRFGPVPVLLLTRPEAVEDVLVRVADAFEKAPLIRRSARTVIGDSVFVAEGEHWQRQRRLLEPLFTAKRVAAAIPEISRHVTAMTSDWEPGHEIQALAATMALSQRIGGRVLFGADVAETDIVDVAAALRVTAAEFQHRIDSPFALLAPDWLPTRSHVERRRAVRRLDRVVWSLIDARRRNLAEGPDLLGELLRQQHSVPWLTDALMRDNVMTLLVESREDPGLLLTWSLALLSREPAIADRLAAEVRDVVRGVTPTPEELARLPFVAAVLHEALRLYPPVYSTGRRAIRDCFVAGISVKRGTVVLLSQDVTNHQHRWFTDPEAFRPDRWLERASDALPAGVYNPFNIGPRRCLGEHLAWTIGLVALAMLVRAFRFLPVDPSPPEPMVQLSLRPSREVLLRVEPRADPSHP
jgi:cytochrome P450